ncbi:MAG: hypothetical protein A2315_14950 [Ignavibacteria bacterium RIFOXYB2_FULL_35_12]|nr:MAG: hypothetical protein A2058_02220 [Ignavibacteria bacterium GWA2_36_19]OGU54573.1 MAG: hypothetical protein A2006_10655 [Ignavibacteria bacterium GWC2_35_8]OGU56516.1 MAG: hypothetical protein A2X60_01315 [Ignavibacteria bacterium GWF2_35_20]OGU81805.1 MAG: hypothetical protein A2254_06355 [Ignavibacteria bacterium RIFOXYA2_FULL_35_9]OGU85945.1 MAG: hypothetical protein A3K31_04255 [Ignavibacteria bacterium RIFOXYA12_FULL_35_25]OGU90748.1 MAG: hypothetical protein A2492_05355 [Ignavibac
MIFKLKIFLALIILFSHLLFAGGLDNNNAYGTKTFTLDGLYFAGSPGLGSIFSNPAGLNFLNGKAFELSLLDEIEENNFKSDSRGIYKSFREENFSIGGGLYWSVGEELTLGLGYFPIVDYRIDWPFVVLRTTDTSSAVLPFSMTNNLEIISIVPSAAFKLGSFYLGVSANIYQINHQISFPINNENWGQNPGLAAYQFKYNLDTWTFGGTIGVMYDIKENLRVGFIVKSGINAEIKGDAESKIFSDLDSASSKTNTTSNISIPWKFGLGFLYEINDGTFLNLDAAYSLYGSENKKLYFTYDDPRWVNRTAKLDSLTGFSANSIPIGSRNTIDLGIGVEHISDGGLIYRAGYRFSQSSNSSASYSFLFPTVDQNTFTIGLGYKDENLTIDAGIAYTFGFTKKVGIDENKFLFGEYSADGYIPSLTLRYNF